uniref:Uncharacterized protein n=1 Tax=Sphaerodactylus townsendi TaxID=933632 RepID=A0ACB8EJC3_9SAUR
MASQIPRLLSYELIPLHSMAVIEGHCAVLGNSIKTEFLCVLGISWTDVFSPAECENLVGQTNPQKTSWRQKHNLYIYPPFISSM